MHPIVVGTAGHIDHGKTALVRALTGIDTDRLAVEKARGITTELGFAKLDLGARRVAMVDVPGHERFVKSMVAGATGLDLVLLVIAADEGVMPQTREHLEICDLLGVRRGIVVLAKSDLVDAEWLAMASSEVRSFLAGSFLAQAPILPVSAKTEAGLDELRRALAKMIDALPPRVATGVMRLPIDRVFTLKGHGTIVTGTLLGGSLAVGDELAVIPSELTARVRSLEVHGASVPRAVAGHRVAVNLGGLAVDELARGDLLVHPGRVAGSHILDIELRLIGHTAPLGPRSKVLVHHGTAQVLATVALVGQTTLAPGATGLAQLRLPATHPLGAVPGDHFIVRGFAAAAQHGSTIGGGRIIRVLAPRARGPRHAEVVAELAAAGLDLGSSPELGGASGRRGSLVLGSGPEGRRGSLDQRLALDVKTAAAAGLARPELVRRLGLPADALTDPLAALVASGELLATGSGDTLHYLHAATVAALEQRINDLAVDGVPREELRTQLPAALPVRAFEAILDGLVRRSAIVLDAERVRRSSTPARPALSPIETTVAEALRRARYEPPRPKDLPELLKLDAKLVDTALGKLVAAKQVVRIKPDFIIHTEPLDELKRALLAFLDQHGTIDAQQWKDLTGASRKFTIPLAEYFDAQKVTLRVGDLRRRR